MAPIYQRDMACLVMVVMFSLLPSLTIKIISVCNETVIRSG
ncbi:hypothetical protein imdm_1442 [gamma proteobacterium IMCC2047]|nr:hypothetical protein imdm_1442 [gamma proteobacterium IMCC2047]